ncbi:MAG: hypothetical protein ACREJB_07510, partial [Planctomycetaceae bacterium]
MTKVIMPSDARDLHAAGPPLGPMDLAMLSVNEVLWSMGHPGFETQALVWLNDRIDAARLRTALGRFAASHPIVTARLADVRGGPRWEFRPDAGCPLHEAPIDSAEPQAVLDEAARLLALPFDPTDMDPLRFHLLHRPDARDVLLVQYN